MAAPLRRPPLRRSSGARPARGARKGFRCSLLVAVLWSLVSASLAEAASYLKTDSTVVDPILDTDGIVHPYDGPDLQPDAILFDASLSRADLTEAALRRANLSGASLNQARLVRADLVSTRLTAADLTVADLTDADLSSSDLVEARLVFTNFTRADLGGTNAFGANLSLAILRDARLVGARLLMVNLGDADVAGADFSGADLMDALNLSSSLGSAFYDVDTDFTGTGFDPVAAGWVLVPEPGAGMLLLSGLLALTATRVGRSRSHLSSRRGCGISSRDGPHRPAGGCGSGCPLPAGWSRRSCPRAPSRCAGSRAGRGPYPGPGASW